MAELTNRDELEAQFAARVDKLSIKHRRELQRLLGTPPSLRNVPEEWWKKVEQEQEDEFTPILFLLFAASAAQHGLDFEQANEQALEYAVARARALAGEWVRNTKEGLRLKEGDWVVRGKPLTRHELRKELEPVFGKNRSDKLAITETTAAQTEGGEAGIGQTLGKQETDTWFTRRDGDVCERCEPLHGQPRSVWSEQFPSGPPAHPRCRCWIRYTSIEQDFGTIEPEIDRLRQHAQEVAKWEWPDGVDPETWWHRRK